MCSKFASLLTDQIFRKFEKRISNNPIMLFIRELMGCLEEKEHIFLHNYFADR